MNKLEIKFLLRLIRNLTLRFNGYSKTSYGTGTVKIIMRREDKQCGVSSLIIVHSSSIIVANVILFVSKLKI